MAQTYKFQAKQPFFHLKGELSYGLFLLTKIVIFVFKFVPFGCLWRLKLQFILSQATGLSVLLLNWPTFAIFLRFKPKLELRLLQQQQ